MIKSYYPRVKNALGLCALALSSIIFTSKPAAAQPTITSVTPNTAIPGPGSTITITGTGFGVTTLTNTVYFGGVKTAPATANLTGTQLTVTVPVGALNANVNVLNTLTKLSVSEKSAFSPLFPNSCFVPGAYNFKPAVNFATGVTAGQPYMTATADFDNDGKLDMITADHGSSNVTIYRNTSITGAIDNTSFSGPTISLVSAGPSNIKIADMDGDGRLDVIIACEGNAVNILRNISTGVGNITFARQIYQTILNKCSEVAIADYDGDGKPDIAAVVRKTDGVGSPTGFDSVMVFRNVIPTTLGVSANFATTHFTSSKFGLDVWTQPTSIYAADFDGDGKIDLVTANPNALGSSSVSVLRNTSTGTTIDFATHVDFIVNDTVKAQQVIAADLDGDGKQDIIVSANNASDSGKIAIFRNLASSGSIAAGSFATRTDYTTPGAGPTGIAVGDMDADGKIDLVVGDLYAFTVTIYRNTSVSGAVSLASTALYSPGISTNPLGVTIADMDGDTKLDIVTANTAGNNISIFRNYPLPATAPITGPVTFCTPTNDTFKNVVAGGTWSVFDATKATINPTSGIVTPIAAGTDTVYYRIICNNDTAIVKKFFTVGVTPTVAAIGGTATSVCTGNSVTLTEATTGGVWASSNPTTATVVNGVVTGLVGGSSVTITYTVTNICGTASATYGPIAINPSPSIITGTMNVCVGGTTALANATTGGTWSSANMPVATVTTAGVVNGVSGGLAVISYTMPGGCYDTALVTVTAGPLVAAITGPASVCLGSDISLADVTPSGTWVSSAPTTASVTSAGVVHGAATGSATISYTVSNSCGTNTVTKSVTVNAVPGNITAPTFSVCPGSTIPLSNPTFGGTWSSSTTSVATVTAAGNVGGGSTGTTIITYTLITGGCFDTALVTVNPLPAAIGGPTQVCVGSTVNLTDATPGGTWSQTGGFAAVNATTGAVIGLIAGTTAITYTETATGCSSVLTPFTVNNLPATITGGPSVCLGVPTALSSSPAGGVWSVTPSSVAVIDPATGIINGVAAGSATVSYNIPSTGCAVGTTVTVFPSPGTISGSNTVCLGGFTTLMDTPPGGIWSSSDAIVAPVNATGIVSGATLGSVTITYTVPGSTCIATHAVTVTPPPSAIAGISTICPNVTIALTDATSGGTWSSNNTAVAVIDPASGMLTGVAGGTAFISYTLTATSCFVFSPITINPGPTVSGPSTVCQGFTAALNVDSVHGTWYSSDTFAVKVDSVSGVVTGVLSTPVVTTPVSALITYTSAGYHCSDTMTVTSYPIVAPLVSITTSATLTLTGSVATVCQGTFVTYAANVIHGGPSPTFQWRVNNVISGTGAVFAYTPGDNDTVKCIMTSSELCAVPQRDTDFVKMTVITRRTPLLALATGMGDTTCLGNAVTLDPHPTYGGTNPTYNWTINGVNVGPGSTFTYVPANNDFIRVVIHSDYICPLVDTASDTLRLTVSPYLTPTLTVVGSDTSCAGYPHVYTAVYTAGGTHPTFQWTVNGANAGTGVAYSYMATDGDVVSVTMVSNFPCVTIATVTATPHTLTVAPVDVPDISLSVSPGYILAPGMTATFTASPVNGGGSPTFRWKKNGIIIPGATGVTYSTNVLANGDIFSVLMTNNDFCNHVTVYASRFITIGDNVGINTVNAPNSDIRVLPNPNKGQFILRGNIGITTNEEVSVEITNMVGQIVYRAQFAANSGAIENAINLGDNLANGMYILNIHSEHLAKTVHFELGR